MPRTFGLARVDGTSGATPGGGGASAVPDLAALAAVNDALLVNGAILGVGTMQDVYELDKASTTLASHPDVVVTLSGVGRWKRKFVGGQSWANQATWFVNTTTGNDENDGTAAVTVGFAGPLATLTEFFKRLRGNPPVVDMLVTLSALGVSADQDHRLEFGSGAARLVRILGTRTVTYSSSFSAVTAYNDATSTSDLVTDAALPVSWSASGLVKSLIRITTAAGAYRANAVVGRDLGARQARISRPENTTTLLEYQPIATDLFDAFTPAPIGGVVTIECSGNGELRYEDCSLGALLTVRGGVVTFRSCTLSGLTVTGGTVTTHACRNDQARVQNGAVLALNCAEVDNDIDAAYALQVGAGSTCSVTAPLLVEALNADGILIEEQGYLRLGDSAAVYESDQAGSAILVRAGGLGATTTNGVYCFGTGSTGYGIDVLLGGGWRYHTNKPTIAGTLGDASVGSYPIDWTMVPFTNPDSNAWIRDAAAETLLATYPNSIAQMYNAGLMPH